ncbi:MAG: nucleotidyltransferase domain-containing protein [Paludibacter sp.]|nr:nucleotidyltransferase domain-containing protein [Paludibacter sp.]
MNDELKYGLQETDIIQVISALQQNQNITKIVLFGSRAKGTYHAGSDVDLALFGDNLGLNDILDLSIEIEKLNLPYMFDLIIYNRIKETALLDHINRVGEKLFEREPKSTFS